MNRATADSRSSDGNRPPAPSSAAPRRAGGGSGLHLYKPGQGPYVRWGTGVAAAVVLIGFAIFLNEQLSRFESLWIKIGVPVVILVISGYWAFRLIGQNRSIVDFMIATEGEMKKVNWSSRREVWGATKVVIATVIALGLTLFIVNIIFMFFFESIDVLQVGMLKQIFGSGE